jgi:hypothetical protein
VTVEVPAGTTAFVARPGGFHAAISGGAHGTVRTFAG